MSIIQAIIYGIIQGITEFLPISSTAHLIALPKVFGWSELAPNLALSFDVALHLGTLVAVVAFFWKDWLNMFRLGFTKPKSTEGKLFWFIVLASIPGAIVGKIFEKQAETTFRELYVIGIMLIIMGIILYFCDKLSRKDLSIEKIGLKRSFLIGLSQALAIIPGVSRSGITMSTGLIFGLTRETAARYSFLLSTPIIFGAVLFKAKDIISLPSSYISFFIVGITTSSIAGLISIKFLLRYLKNKGFGIFSIYRIVFGLILIFVALVK